MSQKPIVMEQLKQILQLKADGIPIREMARRIGISRNSVRKYLALLDTDTEQLSSKELADKAYQNDQLQHEADRVHQITQHFVQSGSELSKTGVTRQLLWQEYIAQHPDGYSYSRYCYYLQQRLKNADLSMHMEYEPGDLMMIDFAGKKQQYIDAQTGECIECQVFIAVLPFSGLIFCKPVHSQKSEDFLLCINAMLMFYRGVSATILCDNFKTAVTRPSRYEPVFTELCYQLSDHYGTTFTATRPYRPRDKAMVEKAVNIVYTNVYAPLRNQHFTSLHALNKAMEEQLYLLNEKPYKKTAYSRWYFYETQEQHSLRPLPPLPFTAKKVVIHTVQLNYHIQLTEDHLYYSVPYQYVGKKVKVLYDARVMEVYFDNARIAFHPRQAHGKAYTTLPEHMPPHHQRMHEIKGWNKDDLLERATRIGPETLKATALMLENSFYIEQNYKACYGMLKLKDRFTLDRLEAACSRALQGSRVNYTMIKNILERGLDKQLIIEEPLVRSNHENLRGKDNYQ